MQILHFICLCKIAPYSLMGIRCLGYNGSHVYLIAKQYGFVCKSYLYAQQTELSAIKETQFEHSGSVENFTYISKRIRV